MLFNTLQFLIFFPIVVLVYFIIPSRLKQLWLLFSSYYFYMCWNAKYAILLLFSTAVTWTGGLLIEKINNGAKRNKNIKKLCVAGVFIINLAILFFFKYFNFAFESLKILLSIIHIELNVPVFDVMLPVGISFYIFQALGYIIDVYRDEIYAEKNFFRYALFISFFPQLVAGPIERSKNMLKQLAIPAKMDVDNIRNGLLLMLWGFFLKIVVADRIAIFVDYIYGNIGDYGGMYIVVASILFAFQIYCDFYGYSTIAMGTARILGIHLMENFAAPYFSLSIAEFWRRWHISLSSWFKDYMYIPLGGNKKGKTRKYINKMLIFLASGLWHGADITYIIWGGLNGLYQIIGEIFMPIRNKIVEIMHLDRASLSHKIFSVVITFILVDFTWIFFRADGITQAVIAVKNMLTIHNPWVLFDGSLYECGLDRKNFNLMLMSILVLAFADICKYKNIYVREVILRQEYWFRCVFYVISVGTILLFGKWGPSFNASNFIYFQF